MYGLLDPSRLITLREVLPSPGLQIEPPVAPVLTDESMPKEPVAETSLIKCSESKAGLGLTGELQLSAVVEEEENPRHSEKGNEEEVVVIEVESQMEKTVADAKSVPIQEEDDTSTFGGLSDLAFTPSELLKGGTSQNAAQTAEQTSSPSVVPVIDVQTPSVEIITPPVPKSGS